jgi:hypothetical protein
MLKSSSILFKNTLKSAAFSSQVDNLFQEGTTLCKLAYLGDLDRIKHYVENEVIFKIPIPPFPFQISQIPKFLKSLYSQNSKIQTPKNKTFPKTKTFS